MLGFFCCSKFMTGTRMSHSAHAPSAPAASIARPVFKTWAEPVGIAAREGPQNGVARKWRRNRLKRLNPRPEMVWSQKPRTHKIWYTAATADRALGLRAAGLPRLTNSTRREIFRRATH